MERFGLDGHSWNGSTVAFFGGRFPFLLLADFFCLSSAMSPGPEGSGLLLLNTILHNWAQHAPLLGLPFLWLFFGSELSFGFFFVFDLWSCLVNLCVYKGASWAKSGANYSLVWSWAVPKGVTFSIPSQGGRARSPFSTIPWKQMGEKVNIQIKWCPSMSIKGEYSVWLFTIPWKFCCSIFTSILLIVLLYSVSSVSALLVSMICSLWSKSFWQIGRLACRSCEIC